MATLAHDQDAGISKTVRDLQWDIIEMLDRNHVAKSFDTKWKQYSFVPGAKRGRWIPALREIEHGLKMWFYSCLKMDEDDEVRTAKWLGATKHYLESDWSGKSDPEAVHLLDEFVRETASLITKVHSRFSTQLCECLNSMKAKLASKGISWKNSWDARVCVAILNFNEGHTWKLDTYNRMAEEWGWQPLPARCYERLKADFAKSAVRLAAAKDPENRLIATKRRIARKTRAFVTLNAAERRGEQLHYNVGDVRGVPAVAGRGPPAPPLAALRAAVDSEPLAFGFINSGCACHLLAVLVVIFSIGPFAREILRDRQFVFESTTLQGAPVSMALGLFSALRDLLLEARASVYPLEPSRVQTQLYGVEFDVSVDECRDPAETYGQLVNSLHRELEMTNDEDADGFSKLCILETTAGRPSAGRQGGRRKPPSDGHPPKEIKNRWPTVQVPETDIDSAFRDFETYLRSRLNRPGITHWPRVLAVVFELRTGGERKLDVPMEFDVLQTEAHPALSYGLIACVKRSSKLIQGHSTAFVLTAEDEDGWNVWRIFDDDKPVRSAYTEPGSLHEFVRIGFFLLRG